MLYLLPSEEKNSIQREYQARRLTLCFALGFFLVAFSIVFLLPSYFLSDQKERAAQMQADSAARSAGTAVTRDGKNSLSDLRAKMAVLGAVRLSASVPIDSVVVDRGPGVQVKEFSYAEAGPKAFLLQIQGVAASRDALLAFVDALRKDKLFSAVDFPISSFAKDSDISFVIGLKGSF